jgi:penicillin-binding protein 2
MWQLLSTDARNPLSNKVIAGVYPPGSTFKPVVAAAALAAGVLTPETAISCPGHLTLGDATFHCWRKGGHGTIRLSDAIKKSCEVFFYETARRLGIDRLAAMARRFGFGATLGLDIPGERPGLIPSREWKLATSDAAWSQGETLIAGIGQGAVLATPLQIAVMVARLVTGRAVVPRLVRTEGTLSPGGDPVRDDFSPLGISPRVLALILDGMNAVVDGRHGLRRTSPIPGSRWAASQALHKCGRSARVRTRARGPRSARSHGRRYAFVRRLRTG